MVYAPLLGAGVALIEKIAAWHGTQ